MANEGIFDELVVDDWLHIEQLDRSEWWIKVGDAQIFVRINDSGEAEGLTVARGVYGPELSPPTK